MLPIKKVRDTNAELRKFKEALQAYDQLLMRQPDMAVAHFTGRENSYRTQTVFASNQKS